ncbi:hypothetical protein FOZ63_011326 [Perkinsus olseni]|uniref:Paraneoplastic Ma antigen n=1 Tax=Perkinsus olseni TaxID=32597 RepID=A0A7J6UDL4_PEROL|nr:hypothetical protein FOZ60_011981 [Perkinsus olseni]KAF4704713.1 hypothetical protein FOZ62_006945 [Perkinsus olseni]KAF4755320.1 hypothetical protein FOZ63_011326 [Perkinsus olseni]
MVEVNDNDKPTRLAAIPKPYRDTNESFKEWSQRFKYCLTANNWSDEIGLRHLPTVLEGPAAALWERLSDEERSTLDLALAALNKGLAPEGSVAFDMFTHSHFNTKSQTIDRYAYQLSLLLDASNLNLNAEAKESLLISKLIAAMPKNIQKDLRTKRSTLRTLQDVVREAKVLQAIEDTQDDPPPVLTTSTPYSTDPVPASLLPSANVTSASSPSPTPVNQAGTVNAITNQSPSGDTIADLSELVLALKQQNDLLNVNFVGKGKGGRPSYYAKGKGRRPYGKPIICDYCAIPGHRWRECRKRMRDEASRHLAMPPTIPATGSNMQQPVANASGAQLQHGNSSLPMYTILSPPTTTSSGNGVGAEDGRLLPHMQ